MASDRRQQIALLRLDADNRALSARLSDAEERVAQANRVWESRLEAVRREWEAQREQQLAELKREAQQAVWEETERLLRVERRADERAEEQFRKRRMQAVVGVFRAAGDRGKRRCAPQFSVVCSFPATSSHAASVARCPVPPALWRFSNLPLRSPEAL